MDLAHESRFDVQQMTPDATNPTANLSDFRTGLSVNSFPHSISHIIHLAQTSQKIKKKLLKYLEFLEILKFWRTRQIVCNEFV